MRRILQIRSLSLEERSAVIDQIKIKSRVLIQGYEKRDNIEKLNEIRSILQEIDQ